MTGVVRRCQNGHLSLDNVKRGCPECEIQRLMDRVLELEMRLGVVEYQRGQRPGLHPRFRGPQYFYEWGM